MFGLVSTTLGSQRLDTMLVTPRHHGQPYRLEILALHPITYDRAAWPSRAVSHMRLPGVTRLMALVKCQVCLLTNLICSQEKKKKKVAQRPIWQPSRILAQPIANILKDQNFLTSH